MAIPTSRTKEVAKIIIHEEKCKGCGSCISVCKDFNLELKNGKITTGQNFLFGCIACGHCMAICPEGAIEINGREMTKDDLIELPDKNAFADYNSLLFLLQKRRSIREFKDKTVEQEKIDKILTAAQTAPMGLPPSDVNVLIFNNKEKLNAFAKDYSESLKSIRFMSSSWFLWLMKPFWGKANDELFKGFIRPLFSAYIDEMKKGNNYITYDAPLAMYFYGSPWADPADPLIAATYAMLAAESLGLGSCMLGGIHPFIQSGKKARKIREKYSIRYKSKEGLILIFGYPAVKYQKAIKRTFANIDYC